MSSQDPLPICIVLYIRQYCLISCVVSSVEQYSLDVSDAINKIEKLKMNKILAVLLGLVATANAIELTADNWDAKTDGKTVFVKFLAPW